MIASSNQALPQGKTAFREDPRPRCRGRRPSSGCPRRARSRQSRAAAAAVVAQPVRRPPSRRPRRGTATSTAVRGTRAECATHAAAGLTCERARDVILIKGRTIARAGQRCNQRWGALPGVARTPTRGRRGGKHAGVANRCHLSLPLTDTAARGMLAMQFTLLVPPLLPALTRPAAATTVGVRVPLFAPVLAPHTPACSHPPRKGTSWRSRPCGASLSAACR